MKKWHSLVAVAALVVLGACANTSAPTTGAAGSGSSSASAAATSASTGTTLNSTTPPSISATPGLPHFASPAEAGRYLADKWNAKDADALHHITNGDSRAQLDDMRTFAKDLVFDTCTKNDDLTYTCEFTHDFLPGKSNPDSVPTTDGHDGPAPKSDPHHGKTALKAVAVSKTGWYFNVFLYCG